MDPLFRSVTAFTQADRRQHWRPTSPETLAACSHDADRPHTRSGDNLAARTVGAHVAVARFTTASVTDAALSSLVRNQRRGATLSTAQLVSAGIARTNSPDGVPSQGTVPGRRTSPRPAEPTTHDAGAQPGRPVDGASGYRFNRGAPGQSATRALARGSEARTRQHCLGMLLLRARTSPEASMRPRGPATRERPRGCPACASPLNGARRRRGSSADEIRLHPARNEPRTLVANRRRTCTASTRRHCDLCHTPGRLAPAHSRSSALRAVDRDPSFPLATGMPRDERRRGRYRRASP